jgi:hypothetical protein
MTRVILYIFLVLLFEYPMKLEQFSVADTMPTFGWICSGLYLSVMAETMLGEEYIDIFG